MIKTLMHKRCNEFFCSVISRGDFEEFAGMDIYHHPISHG